jgi:hypothetical protein
MAVPATARGALCTSTAHRGSRTERYPHTVRYQNALSLYWAQRLEPAEGEGKTIGYAAAHYLGTLIAWADNEFLMTSLHRGEPLSLPNSTQHALCGHSQRHCLRLRNVLERHGLIRVEAGSFNAGASYSAKFVILFQSILGPAEPALAEERRMRRASAPREPSVTATASPGGSAAARTDGPPIDPPVLPNTPRSVVGAGEKNPPNERSSPVPDGTPDVGPSSPVVAGVSCGAATRPAPWSGTPSSTIAREDLTLAGACLRAWQSSPKCPPKRRGELEQAIRSEGDARTVRRIASLARDGVPERILVKAFQECLAAYSPEQDPRYRSPYIQSPVWFQGWIETAAEKWLRERRRSQRLIQEQARRRHADEVDPARTDAERDGASTLATLPTFHDRYARMRYLPPETALLEELAAIDAELARRLRDDEASRWDIVDATACRTRRLPSSAN